MDVITLVPDDIVEMIVLLLRQRPLLVPEILDEEQHGVVLIRVVAKDDVVMIEKLELFCIIEVIDTIPQAVHDSMNMSRLIIAVLVPLHLRR